MVEREPLDYLPEGLEDLIVTSADVHRGAEAMAVVGVKADETITQHLRVVGGGYEPTGDPESADAKLLFGPAAVGGFVRFIPKQRSTPAGPSLAPRAIADLGVADELWNTGIGPLEPAKSVR